MFEGFFNKEAKDESREANVNTGREVEGVTDSLAESQEAVESGEVRFQKILQGIGEIMDEEGIRAEDAMGQEYLFAEKLQEKGIITMKDIGFSGTPEMMRHAVKQVARERLEKKAKDIDERKIA